MIYDIFVRVILNILQIYESDETIELCTRLIYDARVDYCRLLQKPLVSTRRLKAPFSQSA